MSWFAYFLRMAVSRAFLGLSLVLLLFSVPSDAQRKTVKIAYIGPLTGPNTAVGIGTRNSLHLALMQANAAKVLPYEIQFVYDTDDSKPAVGVDAVKKICADRDVVAASAHWNSPVALATSRFFHECGVLNLVSGAASDKITQQGYKEIARVNTPFRYGLPLLGKSAATQLGIKTVAIVKSRDDYGTDVAKSFRVSFEESGGKIVAEEGYNIGDKDFAALLIKIRSSRPAGVFLAGLSTEAALVVRQMRQLGMTSIFLGHPGWQTQTFIDSAKETAEGSVVLTMVPFPEELPGGKAYLAAYEKAAFKEPPDVYGPFGYAAGQILVELLKRHGPDRSAIIEGVRKLRDVETIFGKVSFDSDGEMQPKQVGLAILKDGAWHRYVPEKK